MNTTLEKPIINGSRPIKSGSIFRQVRNLIPEKYWPWLLLVLSVTLISWQTTFLSEVIDTIHGFLVGMFGDFEKGWNVGYKDSYGKEYSENSPIQKTSVFSPLNIFMGIIGLTVLAGLLALFIWFHYKFLYQQLLRRQRLSSGYTVLYVFWLLIFWRGLVFLFNSFKPEFDAESISFATFTTALCILYAFGQNYRQNQRQKQVLIQQRTQAELDALKAQVNPHFLFNSLNNIYGTAMLEESPRTAESIQQLSGIVRYVMEESRLQTTDIQRELRFIDDYVELQRIRLPNLDTIEINTQVNWDEQPAQIVPLLLNPLIENAFKYGISMQYPCFVRINLTVQNGTLHLVTENSVLPRTDLEKGTGLGLANVRQRLTLAYPARHKLTVEEKTDVFLVDLTVKL